MSNNPFIIKGYESKELFCNRTTELQTLVSNIENGVDTTLISARRMGKTGLIMRLFDEINYFKYHEFETLYIDIYATLNFSDFLKALTDAILSKFPLKKSIGKRFFELIKNLRPTISYDPYTGEPQISIFYQNDQQKEYTLRSLLDFLNSHDKPFLIAIDEFQQINEYPEKNVEALLRSHIQQLGSVRFIFCGSQKSLMVDIFSNAKRPFYASTHFLHIDSIDKVDYSGFIQQNFEKAGRRISNDALEIIISWTRLHTFYTQSLCNQIFALNKKDIDEKLVWKACLLLLKANEPVFFQYRQLLTSAQWNYLIAVAKEGEVSQITASGFLSSHNIGTPANARRLNQALIEKELILEIPGKERVRYRIYDVFLSRWLEMEY
jgi:uncharacterized protein